MRNSFRLITFFVVGCILILTACKKDDFENKETLQVLYKTYKDGEISECYYNGELVFSTGLNAYDAGSMIYDKEGNTIGNCNYAWGQVDELCGKLEDCEVIYRVKDNIWGQAAVDKYGLQ